MATGNPRFMNLLKAASLATLLGTTATMAAIPNPGDPRGIEFQVNTTTQFSQSNPSVASDAAGDSVVVWTGFTLGSDGGLHDGVVAQRYAPDGQRVGVEFQVNNFSLRFNDSKLQPRVAMDAAGDFVVTWYEQHVDNPSDFFNSPQEYNVFAKLYDKTGTALGPEFQVNATQAGDRNTSINQDFPNPVVAMDAAGAFVIAWTNSTGVDGNSDGIFAQRFDSTGAALSPGDIQVNVTTTGSQAGPSIAMSGDGAYVIAWTGLDAGNGTTQDPGVDAQLYAADGSVTKAEFLVNTHLQGQQNQPTAAMDTAGDFVIAWSSNFQDGNGFGIYAQRYDHTGSAAGGEFQVNTTAVGHQTDATTGNQTNPAAAMAALGDFAIYWISPDTSNNGIFGQSYSADGTARSRAEANTTITNEQLFPAVAMDAAGDAFVVWQSHGGQDGDGIGVFGQRFLRVASIDLSAAIDTAPHGVVQPGDAIVVTASVTNDATPATPTGIAAIDAALDHATGVEADITLPSGTIFSSITGSTWTCPAAPVADVLACTLSGELLPGVTSAVITVNLRAGNNGGVQAFSNDVAGDQPDAAAANNDASAGLTVDHAPVANQGTLSVLPGSSNNPGTLTATDADGDPLTFSKLADPTHGTATVNADGSFTYTPAPDFNGNDFLLFKANDGTLDSATASVKIAVDHAPVASDGVLTVNEDSSNNAGTLVATDADNNGLSFSAGAVGPAHGTVTVHSDGSYTYTPNPLFFGTDSFTFKVSDLLLTSNVATVTITVNHVNHVPTASDGLLTVNQDTSNDAGTLVAADLDVGDTLTFSKLTDPAHGAVTVDANGGFSYTPNAGFVGSDSFIFKANDGTVDSNTATVNITVKHVNHAPVADSDSLATDEDVPGTGTLTASDVDGDTLSFVKVSGPSHGSLTVNLDGSFSYTPNPNFNGSDGFTFSVNDAHGGTAIGAVSITVTAVDDAPVAADGTLTVDQDTSDDAGTLAASDVDSALLTFSKLTDPAHGAVTVDANGGFSYTPNAGFVGSDSFTFKASDGTVDSNTATVSITVAHVNHTPAATAGTLAVNRNTAKAGSVAGSDPDSDALSFSVVSPAAHGTLVMQASGSFTYTPAKGFFGTDSFSFKANDGNVDSAPATVAVTVTEHAPVGLNQVFSMTHNTVHRGTFKVSDKDSGDKHSFSRVTSPKHGTLVINATTGAFSYTPARGFVGKDAFTFRVSDGAKSDTATVSITVK